MDVGSSVLFVVINVQLHYGDVFLFFLSQEVNFEELARCTDDFNGAQLKAVCVEAVSITCLGFQVVEYRCNPKY